MVEKNIYKKDGASLKRASNIMFGIREKSGYLAVAAEEIAVCMLELGGALRCSLFGSGV